MVPVVLASQPTNHPMRTASSVLYGLTWPEINTAHWPVWVVDGSCRGGDSTVSPAKPTLADRSEARVQAGCWADMASVAAVCPAARPNTAARMRAAPPG